MKMNVLVAVLAVIVGLGFAQAATTNYMVVSNVKTVPAEIYAGDDVNLSFLIFNAYYYSADDVMVQLTGGFPLMEVSPSQSIRVNAIPSGLNQLGIEPLNFRLKVDPNAPAGTYTLNVVATYGTVTETKLVNGATGTLATVKTDTMPISIRVRGAPHLAASLVSQGVEPGVKSIATLSIINDGTDTAKGAVIELNSTDVFEVLGTSTVFLGDIESGKGAQASFSIRAKEDAPSKKHELPVGLTYSNKYGKEFSYSPKVPILVSVYLPALEVTIADTTARPRAGDESAIMLQVRNRGDGLAKNARLQISGAGPVEVKWPTGDISLGDIAGGAMLTATLRVKVQEGASEQAVSLPVRLTYSSSNKQQNYDAPAAIEVDLERSANFQVETAKTELRPNELWKEVQFTVKNTGNVPARELKATLNTQYPLTPSGKEQYVQELMPGESMTVSFHVDVDSKAVPQDYPVDIYFQWKEDGEKVYSVTKSSSLSVLGGAPDNTIYLLGGLGVLAVAGFVVKKKMGKKK